MQLLATLRKVEYTLTKTMYIIITIDIYNINWLTYISNPASINAEGLSVSLSNGALHYCASKLTGTG